jgi:hypothetical protein
MSTLAECLEIIDRLMEAGAKLSYIDRLSADEVYRLLPLRDELTPKVAEALREWADKVRGRDRALAADLKTAARHLGPGRDHREALRALPDLQSRIEVCMAVHQPAGRRATVRVRMLDRLTREPESVNWSIRKWAASLECSPGAIADCPVWDELQKNREAEKQDRTVRDRRRSG